LAPGCDDEAMWSQVTDTTGGGSPSTACERQFKDVEAHSEISMPAKSKKPTQKTPAKPAPKSAKKAVKKAPKKS
jgi:hypothetical protein